MKKMIKYLLMIVSLITLSGCEDSATIKESRTIVLNVDSEVTPIFTSNFGSGSYDEETKKYTHTIDYIKDLYIFLSYDDLKTVTVHIPTSDMNEKTITKDVEFGQMLDAEVEITIEGVKTLDGLEMDDELNYSNLKVGKKNTFKFTLPSRDIDYNIKFTLPQYKEFNVDLSAEDLISGGAKVSTIALTVDQIYIGFEGNQYEYKIYSQTTNQLVSSGGNYENQSSTQYVVLPNSEGYYVRTSSSVGKSALYKVNVNENVVFDVGGRSSYSMGYINVFGPDEHSYYQTKLYNKDTKIIQRDHSLYGSIDSYGILVRNSEDKKWYYLSDLKNHVEKQEDSWENKYYIDFSKMVEATLYVTRINLMTNEVISSQTENYIDIDYDVDVTYDNNVFSFTIKEMLTGYVSIDLYSNENEKIETIEEYIPSYFNGDIFSATVEYKGRTIPCTFPIFVEDLVYSNDGYTYPDQIIDTDVSLVAIKLLDSNGWIQTLSSNDYIMDEEQEVIMGTPVGNSTYFELYVGNTYTFKYDNLNYSFTVTEDDINAGYVLVINESIRKVQVKIPEDYYLIIDNYSNMKFYPDTNGIVSVPVGESKHISGRVSNGFVESNSKNIVSDNGEIVEFYPFYVFDGGQIYVKDTYGSNVYTGTNDVEYYYIYPNENESFPTSVITNIHVKEANNDVEFEVNISDFAYNEEYKAYYYNLEDHFDHVVVFTQGNFHMFEWTDAICYTSEYNYEEQFFVYTAFVNNGLTMEYTNYDNSVLTHTFTDNNEKYLDAIVSSEDYLYTLTITPSN